MRFLILRILTHSELGFFHQYRRQGLEKSRQRAINFDWDVVDRVFPAAKDSDLIPIRFKYLVDHAKVNERQQTLKRQAKNWRLTGDCIPEEYYRFVRPGCLFAMAVDASATPARGSWAVFPESHEVTRSILNDAESSRLAQSAMIALHGEEGRKTAALLSLHCPALFNDGHKPAQITPNMTKHPVANQDEDPDLAPSPKRLVDMLAHVGHDLNSAAADIIDNAIEHGATAIHITFPRPDAGQGRWMAFSDNGKGMSQAELLEAMRVGTERTYAQSDLGKYGYGLKGASWSQADRLTVVTKKEGDQIYHLRWDKQHLESTGKWKPLKTPLEPWEKEVADLGSHGTCVLWAKMHPPLEMPTHKGMAPYESEIADLERHIALVFQRFLDGKAQGRQKVSITINNKIQVAALNPVGHALTQQFDRKEIVVPVGTTKPRLRVQAFLTPSEEEMQKFHAKDGNTEVLRQMELISLYGRRNETQGFFIYRCDRLIKWGGWADMFALEEKTKLVRVVLDFDQSLDEPFRVNIAKQEVILPKAVKDQIMPLLKEPRALSREKYRRPKGPKGPTGPGPGPGPGPKGPGPTGPGPGPTGPGPGPGPGPDPESVVIRKVKSSDFVWKITTNAAGKKVLHISENQPSAVALLDAVQGNPSKEAALLQFLQNLDSLGLDLQSAWLKAK